MNAALKTYYMLRYLGPRLLWLRAGVYAGNLLGRTRRAYAPRPWDAIDLGRDCESVLASRPFLFPLGEPPAIPGHICGAEATRQPPLDQRLRLIAEMRHVYMFRLVSPRPVEWDTNGLTGQKSSLQRSWFELPDFDPAAGDMRTMWDPGRAAWAIDLARAKARGLGAPADSRCHTTPADSRSHTAGAPPAGRRCHTTHGTPADGRSHTDDESLAGLYWRWFESFYDACPPYMGPQWKCGQEASTRLIALAIGFWAFARDAASTPERWRKFARLVWATGHRVEHHIAYAVSQKNNHAISEACGLMLAAHLCPHFAESPRWGQTGRRVLEQEILRQTYADGSYVQQSMNYERVMLQIGMLGVRLAELAGQPFERRLYDALGRAGEFLFQMMDPDTGRLPNYGGNDGAWVLPLSECDYSDFRPAVQAAHHLAHRQRLLPPGAGDEDLLWLFGPAALQEPPPSPPRRPASSAFETGGYFTIRSRESWLMTRCHTYVDRPSHPDLLAIDLWWRGQNILTDCGTYQYYTPQDKRIEAYFKSIAAHNTIQLGDDEPMELVSRFLWLPWPRARLRDWRGNARAEPLLRRGPSSSTARQEPGSHDPGGEATLYFDGEQFAWDRPPWKTVHRRAILGLEGDAWVVVDDLIGPHATPATLRWHLCDAPYEFDEAGAALTLHTRAGPFGLALAYAAGDLSSLRVVRGLVGPERVQGLAAPYYGEWRPIPVLEAAVVAARPLRIVTLLSPCVDGALSVECAERDHIRIACGPRAFELTLAPPAAGGPAIVRDVRSLRPVEALA